MESTKTILTFKVVRKNPELITPAKPTPHEFKFLSDIDDQEGLRFHIPMIQIYRRNPSVEEGKDPVKVIREAIGKALVFYYPFAGRLRQGDANKLLVECTGEGVIFIEADADVTLHQFGDALHPPFPCIKDLLYNVPGSTKMLHSLLILFQVTRLKCGGFIFALRFNHTMCDAIGLMQFLSAIEEITRGAEAPSITPVWERHLLNARNPPRLTCTHRHYDGEIQDTRGSPPRRRGDMVLRSFFFGAAEFAALRSRLPPNFQVGSRMEVLTACMWRCRTIAISPTPEANEEVRLLMPFNFRKLLNPPLPDGYYGNVVMTILARARAGELRENPLQYAVELVRRAKEEVTEEYMKSLVDLMVMRGRRRFTVVRCYMVSDVRHIGMDQVDYGWGKPVYGGATDSAGGVSDFGSFYVSCKNNKGEEGILVPICLPSNAMEVFVKELQMMLNPGGNSGDHQKIIPSAL